MLICFSNRLLMDAHCTDQQVGQAHIVTCPETGVEMIWSPTEAGSLDSAMAEHHAAHDKVRDDEQHRLRSASLYAHARQVYRTTEPGDPARRGIGAYL